MFVFLRTKFRYIPHLVDARCRNTILRHLPLRARSLGYPSFLMSHWRPGRYCPKIFLNLSLHSLRINVTGNHQRRVGCAIVCFEPLLHIVQGCRAQIFHGSNDGPGIRMGRRPDIFHNQFLSNSVRLIFPLTLFVLNYTALFVKPSFVYGGQHKSHPI